jgi:hypothetical protein
MLKRYFAQVLFNTLVLAADESAGGRLLTTRDIIGEGEEPEESKWENVQMDPELTEQQRTQMLDLLHEFSDVFQNTPGEADLPPFNIPTGRQNQLLTTQENYHPNGRRRFSFHLGGSFLGRLLEDSGPSHGLDGKEQT